MKRYTDPGREARRRRLQRQVRKRGLPIAPPHRETPQQAAARLVRQGVCSPQILGPRPPREKTQR